MPYFYSLLRVWVALVLASTSSACVSSDDSARLQQRAELAEMERETVRHELDLVKKELNEVRQAGETAENQLAQLDEELREKQRSHDALKSSLEAAEHRLDALRQTLARVRELIQNSQIEPRQQRRLLLELGPPSVSPPGTDPAISH